VIIPIKPLLSNRFDLLKEIKYIDKNRYYSNYGPLYYKAKKKIERHLNLKKNAIVLSSSGHSSLLACLILLRTITKKKYIIVPSFSFYSDVQCIISANFEPIFIDVKITDYTLDESLLKELIIKKDIAGILFVSPFGYPIDINYLNKLKKKYSVHILYDAADTFINFQKDIDKSEIFITCSFHPTKTLPANESGMVIVQKKYQKDIESILNFGYFGKDRKIKFIGFNGKFSEYDGAIFLSNFKKLKKIRNILKKKISFLKNKTASNRNISYQKNLGKNWVSKTIFIFSRKNFSYKKVKQHFRSKGIVIYKPWSERSMHENKIFNKYHRTKLNVTRKLKKFTFSIPFYLDQKYSEINYIAKIMNNFFKN
jgi:dTDP-4-amino-4,6-dideoxygalactose transaminase